MKKETIVQCAESLYQAFVTNTPIDRLSLKYPEDLTIEAGYAIQSRMLAMMEAAGRHPAGHKIGLTSKAMRDLVHIQEPDYGRIFYEDCFHSGAEVACDRFIYPRIEAEILFKLKESLDRPNITEEDVVRATQYFVPAFEIIDNRYRIEGQLISDSIADNAANGAYVIGDEPCYFGEHLSNAELPLQGINLEKNGRQIDTSTCAAVMGNPTTAVAWLANKMFSLGEPLKAGELVLSGSIIAAVDVQKGDYFRCDYGSLGYVSVHFV